MGKARDTTQGIFFGGKYLTQLAMILAPLSKVNAQVKHGPGFNLPSRKLT